MLEPIRVLNIFMVLDRGGAETFVMNVYRNIDRSRVQFDFLVHGDRIGAYEEEIEKLGGRIYRLPSLQIYNYFKYKKAVKDFLNSHLEYKIIHSHASELGFIIFKEAEKLKIPFRICHAHSAPNNFNIKTPIRFFANRLMRLYSNYRLACSKEAAIWQFGSRCSDYCIIKNGIDINKFCFDEKKRNTYREKIFFDDCFIVGHVGRFEKQKNHTFLISVFCEMKRINNNCRLILIGTGSIEEEIKKTVLDLGLNDSVAFLGVQKEIVPYLCAMDVFVFPSLFEGLGISLIEAQANGLKCFVSDAVPNEANVTNLYHRIELKKSAKQWAEEILSVKPTPISQRNVYPQIVKKSGYDIRKSAQELQEFYEDLIKKL